MLRETSRCRFAPLLPAANRSGRTGTKRTLKCDRLFPRPVAGQRRAGALKPLQRWPCKPLEIWSTGTWGSASGRALLISLATGGSALFDVIASFISPLYLTHGSDGEGKFLSILRDPTTAASLPAEVLEPGLRNHKIQHTGTSSVV